MASKNRLRLIKLSQVLLFFVLLSLLVLSVLWPKRNIVWEWQEAKRIKQEIKSWEESLKSYPDYRDVYLRLAILNWQIKQPEKAREYLEKAESLDPNYEVTKKLKELID